MKYNITIFSMHMFKYTNGLLAKNKLYAGANILSNVNCLKNFRSRRSK